MAPVNRLRKAMFGDHPELTEDERRLVLRAMAVIATPIAVFFVIVVVVGGGFAVHELRARTQDNKDAIKQVKAVAKEASDLAIALNLERANRENALAWQVFDQCVETEALDENLVEVLEGALALSMVSPPSAARDQWQRTIRHVIAAREPPEELDCKIPLGARPGSSGGANAP